MNYFQLFGLEIQFTIDLDKLSTIYQTLQKKVHPDRFAHGSNQEQMLAVKKSTLINDAYQTLKKPLKRAQYLLELRGISMPNEQASFGDVSFLMHQMELREMLDEVKHADDVDAAVFDASQVFEAEFQQLFNQLQSQLAENTPDSNSLACDNLRKLKFYQKLNLELDKLEELLLDG
ncbi:co-chaperone HscB [Colwellia sp. MB02u-18]|uniref:co-chaperone HscB n=1 Tax=unclassified Colwellia TaxID=196834 RepID=UPI0015F4B894|nr:MULTISPECIES: co-chaperone HscB [unclassified Colwellia]MBA6224447.1 co-chaperone HscB [Colwellia sp. MB3u-45]MBA6267683.1 co-chaperone HscB [Colwellia sp. MB3u-43]MBA6322141.1 co-chaperone HscB [Colwellia sp. MB02u-19]MBA6326271.1 co-chaperone HscB [Colwellia sp. MB02u-18]MBA6331730.1 co-chaperone HscB [Colwellia sp. MB02u-12]